MLSQRPNILNHLELCCHKNSFKSKIKWKEFTFSEDKQSIGKSIPRLELVEGISSTYNIFRRWKIKNSTSSIIPKEGTHNI
jgi:hypothetical protein